MEKFIRIDVKGEWMGTEHVSSLNGLADESQFEEGISCYSLKNKIDALENLRYYWQEIAMLNLSDYERMQITIFEGEKIGEGSDWEDLAICQRTVAELNAKPIMQQIYELYEEREVNELDEDEGITEDEYEQQLANILDLN